MWNPTSQRRTWPNGQRTVAKERRAIDRSYLLPVLIFVPIAGQAQEKEWQYGSVEKMSVTEDFAPYLKKAPILLQGGARLFADGNDWVAIAVGRAPLENKDGKRIPVRDAKKVARKSEQRLGGGT